MCSILKKKVYDGRFELDLPDSIGPIGFIRQGMLLYMLHVSFHYDRSQFRGKQFSV